VPYMRPRMRVLHAGHQRRLLWAWRRCTAGSSQSDAPVALCRALQTLCALLARLHATRPCRRPGSGWRRWRLDATSVGGREPAWHHSIGALVSSSRTSWAAFLDQTGWHGRRQIGFNPRPCPQKRAPPSAPARVSFLPCAAAPLHTPSPAPSRSPRRLPPLSSDRRRARAQTRTADTSYGDACEQPRGRLNISALSPAPLASLSTVRPLAPAPWRPVTPIG
jgi:hypothetical protein